MMTGIEPIIDVESHFVGIWTVEDALRRVSFCFTQLGNAEALE